MTTTTTRTIFLGCDSIEINLVILNIDRIDRITDIKMRMILMVIPLCLTASKNSE